MPDVNQEQDGDLEARYDAIIGHVTGENGHTVLLLGPELAALVGENGEGHKTYFKKLVDELAANQPDTNGQVTQYFPTDNLFSFNSNKNHPILVRNKVVEFFKHENYGDKPLLDLISRLPIPLIINVCPDDSVRQLFEIKNIEYSWGYFSKDPRPEFKDIPKPTETKPVIYNIFGSIKNDQSILLTHGNLYTLIEKLLPENSLPPSIEEYIKEANSFIFLGFKFDSWYYQLLCHKLKVKTPGTEKISIGSPSCNNLNSVIMKNHFELAFTQNNPTQVIERIIAGCQAEDLRPLNPLGIYCSFISYAWKDKNAAIGSDSTKREAIADFIESALKEKSVLVQLVREKKFLNNGDSIDSFMTRIGSGRSVIQVISDKYLKSEYCMIEAMRINQYRDPKKRIFLIVFNDVQRDRNGHIDIEKYEGFWKQKCLGLVEDRGLIESPHYKNYIEIYHFIKEFIISIDLLLALRIEPEDIDGSLDLLEPKKKSFQDFIEFLIEKMKE
jgi:hypothetical protein